LDPLSADEFTAVAAVLSREQGVGDGWRIASIELVERRRPIWPHSTTAVRRPRGALRWSAWKHVDHDAGAEVRRMRRLTVSFHFTRSAPPASW
jgi:hypothetical protein